MGLCHVWRQCKRAESKALTLELRGLTLDNVAVVERLLGRLS